MTLLEVENLQTSFHLEDGWARAVDGVSFTLGADRTLGVVGESGCGKTVTALSIMRLLPKPTSRIDGGAIRLEGVDLLQLPISGMHGIRGRKIGMIFQEPMTALNPVHTVGRQLAEVYRLHFPNYSAADVRKRSLDMLARVGIAAPDQRLDEYPHQLSGGMRQRVMIAMALACEPRLLIADEPTTALDVTIQAQILELIRELKNKNGMAVLFITHDLGVIAGLSDEVIVMYGGKVVEHAPVGALFEHPRHPYTSGLLRSIPRLEGQRKTKLDIIPGMVPTLREMPPGCRFQNRCALAQDTCRASEPTMAQVGPAHGSLCHFWRDV